MKKLFLITIAVIFMTGCRKDDILPIPEVAVTPELKMTANSGIKLSSPFVTSEVSMNVKLESSGTVSVKILDIANRVVSKETMEVKAGDNILKVYTNALPKSAYRIALYDVNNVLIGITDFNKL
jgi:hypothetical protein